MTREQSVLVLGGHGSHLSDLAERTRQMGYRTVRAKTPVDALELAEERGFFYGAALMEPDLPAVDLAETLGALRELSASPVLVFIATGAPAGSEVRRRLRDAGVTVALWEPVSDHALRFQLNSAMAKRRAEYLRSETRIPTNMTAGIVAGGRRKTANVYNLSGGGAFLETGRPSMAGANITIEFPFPAGVVRVVGQVLYTNVPGNLACSSLPTGMAVRFSDDEFGTCDEIRRNVSAFSAHYLV
ncbi:MAG: PilZ domain-containing protein [Deltaproteobacteria bacterium]|nr:PilZ domain-containing protein [Deltaproteobacteria bacterium]MBW2417955.1 PilZ domain-containing protein [Deltaproteobacteria bacterium]